MNKKLSAIILSVIILFQLFIAAGIVTDSYIAEIKGEKVRIHVEEVEYYTGNICYTVSIKHTDYRDIYAELKFDKNGIAELYTTSQRPKHSLYIRSLHRNSFYYPDSTIKTEEYEYKYLPKSHFRKNYIEDDLLTVIDGYFNEAYIEVSVYKGRVGEAVLYIDGIEATQFYADLYNKVR